jgi:hypothetical protein
MTRRLVMASAIAVVAAAAFLPGSGFGSSAAVARGAHAIPASLAAAIHARLGAGAIRSSYAARAELGGPIFGFGVSLSADGTTALVGAPGVAGNKGAAYIFHVSDAGSWTSQGTPMATLSKGTGQTLFGAVVSLSADGTTAFIGAPFTGAGLFGPGAIYVFQVSGEEAWKSSSKPTATLTVSHGVWLGIALAASPDGTTLVAGAPFYNSLAGGAYVFHVASENAWSSSAKPIATLSNGGEQQEVAGDAVAISGDGTTVLLGDDGNASGGGAFLYHASGEDAWASSSVPTAILTDSNSVKDDSFGSALALSGDGTVALVGGFGVNSGTGAADVFHASAADAWATTSTPTATLTNAGASGDVFGQNLALSSDGTTALVLAPGVNANRGAGYIFHALNENAWLSSSVPTATLTKSGAHAGDTLGIGVLSSDGATALVGAPGVRLKTGAAYVFHVLNDSSWVLSSSPTATLTDEKLAACTVPKLKGLKLKAAKTALLVGRCQLGKVKRVHTAHKRSRGHVLSQSKKPRSRLAINAKVNVRVGK